MLKIRSVYTYAKGVFFTFRKVVEIAFSVQKFQVITLLFLSAVVGFLTFPALYLDKLIIDSLVRSVGQGMASAVIVQLLGLIALTLVISTLTNFIQAYTRYLRRITSRYVSAEIDLLVAKKVSELSLSKLENSHFADRFQKIEHESGRRAWAMMLPISNIPGAVVGLVSSVTILFLLHPLIAVGAVIFSLPQLFVDSKYIKREYDLDSRLAPLDRVWGWLNHYLTRNRSFGELKVLGVSDYLALKLKNTQRSVLRARTRINQKRDLARFWTEIPLVFFEFATAIFLVVLVISAQVTMGSFQFYSRTLRSAENYLQELATSILELYENYLYVNDLVWLLKQKSELERNTDAALVLAPGEPVSVEFRNVWFKYKKTQDWTLKNFNLVITPNEKLAIVGLNGAGKSTFIKLLCGFYRPGRGEVLINGIKLENYDVEHWRKSLSVLFQEFESYVFTAQEAIGYGDVDRLHDARAITRIAERTGIDDFIQGLPLKYANPLDPQFDKGIRPSLGQAQRIGIARMLYRESANLIIMDEPTSSVDPEAEEKIFEEVKRITENKTLVFVTQRFSTVRVADRIAVIGDGKVIEEGTHKKLMSRGSVYAKLFNLQAEAYKI